MSRNSLFMRMFLTSRKTQMSRKSPFSQGVFSACCFPEGEGAGPSAPTVPHPDPARQAGMLPAQREGSSRLRAASLPAAALLKGSLPRGRGIVPVSGDGPCTGPSACWTQPLYLGTAPLLPRSLGRLRDPHREGFSALSPSSPWISSLPCGRHEAQLIPKPGVLLSASSARPEPSLHSSHFFAELQISTSSPHFLKYPWHQLDFIPFAGKKMKQEGQGKKSHFSLQVSIILRFIVQEPLVTQKPLSPRVRGSCGEHLGLFLSEGLGSESAAHPGDWQINPWVKGNCRVKGNPPVPSYRCWRQREQDLAEHPTNPSSAPPLQGRGGPGWGAVCTTAPSQPS